MALVTGDRVLFHVVPAAEAPAARDEAARDSLKVQVPTVAGIAGELFRDALRLARLGVSDVRGDADLAELLRNPAFVNLFKYRLACAAGEVLGAYDSHAEEVYYIYNPAAALDAEEQVDRAGDVRLHLLLQVTPPTAALQSLIAALDFALVRLLKQLPSESFASLDSVLDVNMMTAAEVQSGTGWAAALKSAFAPPVHLWPIEA